ncbi:MAG: homoserine O-acetyltransferase [Candidatus Contendobacter sp.]
MSTDAYGVAGTVRTPLPPERNSGHHSRSGQPLRSLRPLPRDIALWDSSEGFTLERGGALPEVRVRYETYGRLNARRDNAILIFHALTGSAHLAGCYSERVWAGLSPQEQAFGRQGWWDSLVGPGKVFDTRRYYIVCANHLGSCYGSTGPLVRDPRHGHPYGPKFPPVTVADLARVQGRLLERLGVEAAILVGGSLGGMVALEFALSFPRRSKQLIVMAAPARHGPWARAWNSLAREAIRQDPGYHGGRYRRQPAGLALARAIATLSYRAPSSFELRWGPEPLRGEAYLLRQGGKFVGRFDANSYLTLSEAMDSHDVGKGRGGLSRALAGLKPPALFIGIDSDLLYPSAEVEEVARLARAEFALLHSPHGHDAFLIEDQQVAAVLEPFLGQP